jgi:NADH-quinone oxidoreductase subunit G
MGALTSKPYAFLSRPWELKNIESVDIFDTYHSSLRFDYRGNEILRVLPVLDARVNEEWISDKSRFFYDALQKQRISVPWLNALTFLMSYPHNLNLSTNLNRSLIPVSWSVILETFERILSVNYVQNKSVSFLKLLGNTVDLQNLYSFKQLFLNFNGISYFKNSTTSLGLNDFRINYLINKSFLFTRAKRLFLIYFNPRFELPILNIKLRSLVNQNKIQVFGFTYNFLTNFEIINLGPRLSNFFKFLGGRSITSKLVGLKSSLESAFLVGSGSFSNSLNFAQSAAIYKNLLKLSDINKTFQFFFVSSQPSSISSSELNIVSPIDLMSKANNKFNSSNVVFTLNYQNDETKILQATDNINLYFGTNGDFGALNADLVFPVSTVTEEEKHFLNLYGLIRKSKLVLYPNYPEIRSFASITKILNNLAYRNFINFNKLKLTTPLFFELSTQQVDYSAVTSLNIEPNIPQKFLHCTSSSFSTILPTTFINDFFLVDSITRSSQFLSLAAKNYSQVTTNFIVK